MELSSILFVFMCLISYGLSGRLLQTCNFSVLDNGAVGDGTTDDTQAFQKAWQAMCTAESDNPTLEIPAGKTFLLNVVDFEGPCKSNNVHVSLMGNIVAPKLSAWNADHRKYWIKFSDVNGLTLDGSGHIEGNGESWWNCGLSVPKCERPRALDFTGCNDLRINGITSQNTPKNHISIGNCKGVTVSNIHLMAPHNSPNTDGIDIAGSTNVQIQSSTIQTGDDCVAINSGSSFINITNVMCGPGHGISVGSLGKYGEKAKVEEIHVSNCNFSQTTNGIRIKTFPDGTGYARKITFEKIRFDAVKNPIIIDQHYCPHTTCEGQESKIRLSDIRYNGIHGTSTVETAIKFDCSARTPCTNIVTNDVNIVSMDGSPTIATCANAQGKESSTTPIISCLSSS